MSARQLLEKAAEFGPVLFGIAFLGPLIGQSLDAASLSAPLGLSNIQFGLAIGIAMGTIAKMRGSWV